MICPNCGSVQRESEKCVQCHVPFPLPSKAKLDPSDLHRLSTGNERGDKTSVENEKKPLPSEKVEKPLGNPVQKEAIRVVEPEQRPAIEERSQKVLITTTQKVEGKKITMYFGLVSANIIVELEDQPSPNAPYRSHLKTAILLALRDLRGEAALFGANAVIAASFNLHKVEPRSLLLSAIGTAVLIEDLK
jgi:uncharacterized protein YbjQ (UPF0145 family)